MTKELHSKSVSELRQGLKSKDFSCSELTEHFLSRAEKDSNSCFRELYRERATGQAKQLDEDFSKVEKLPLAGIPISLKDILVTDYGRSSAGSKMLADYESPFSATAVSQLEEAGAVVIGKTNMDEFGMGSSSENCSFATVTNPWNKERVSGGSSGGAAAAVAADLCPISIGSDTGGSVRQPAAFCGVSGLKPTYGRVSRYGLIAYASSLDSIGPLARSASDCLSALQVMSGKDPFDATSRDLLDAEQDSSEKVRIAFPNAEGLKGTDQEVLTAFEATLKNFEAEGAELVETDFEVLRAAVSAYYITACAEAASNLARYDGARYGYRTSEAGTLEEMYLRSRSEGFGSEVKRRILLGNFVLSSGYYDEYYGQAEKARAIIRTELSKILERTGFIALPTAPSTAFEIGSFREDPLQMYLQDSFTVPANLCGFPCISIPCGFDNAGLPIGFQLMGAAFAEEKLCALAAEFQQRTDFHTQAAQEAQ